MVDESSFMEQTIQFQNPVLDAVSMREVLHQQFDLKSKLDKVREAALELLNKDAPPASVEQQAEGLDRKKKRSDKKDKKAKKRENGKKTEEKGKKEKEEKKREREEKEETGQVCE